MDDENTAKILLAVSKVEELLRTICEVAGSIDERLGRVEAGLNRLDPPLRLDAGSEVEAVH